MIIIKIFHLDMMEKCKKFWSNFLKNFGNYENT